MALFTDEGRPPSGEPPRRSRRRTVGWFLLLGAVIVAIVFVATPSPYVIERPGPHWDTLGTSEHTDEDGQTTEVPLIDIPEETTYPTEGSLSLLTVSVVGRPGSTPNWLELGGAWLDPTQSILPLDAVYPPEVSPEDRDAQNQAAMVDSQQDAIAAALLELGFDFPRDVTVVEVSDDSPAAGALEADDVIRSVNGTEVHDIAALRAEIAENGTGQPATLLVDRGGDELELELTPVDAGGTPVLGIGVTMHYEFPFEVDIRLDDVGGPSAGQMFALGIVDKLTPGPMTGGEDWAGTGTIDSAGNVGPIGGIRQKMYGALDAGAKWFLAPASNCDEVVGHVPDGLRVFAVETLEQSIDAVEAVATGGDLDALPSCPSP